MTNENFIPLEKKKKKKKYNSFMPVRIVSADITHRRESDGYFHYKVTDRPLVYAKHIEITNKKGEQVALIRLRNLGILAITIAIPIAKTLFF